MTTENEGTPQRTVVVAGDVTTDWNLARVKEAGSAATWTAGSRTHVYRQKGGAALLKRLVEDVAVSLGQPGPPAYDVRLGAGAAGENHSFAIWRPYQKGKKSPEDEQRVWRINEFLGQGTVTDVPQADEDAGGATPPPAGVAPSSARAEIVVLDDANLGFRKRDGEALPAQWPAEIREGEGPRWVVLKMSDEVCKGGLWDHLQAHFKERLIVLMTVGDLRLREAQVSRELSWERTAQDLYGELLHNPCLRGLAGCAHVVISFGPLGALWFEGGARRTKLYFDPDKVEGAAGEAGNVIGYTSCLAASVARELMRGEAEPKIGPAVRRGVAAMRKLYEVGYCGDHPKKGRRLGETYPDETDPGKTRHLDLVFPFEAVVAELNDEREAGGALTKYAEVEVKDPTVYHALRRKTGSDARVWTILGENHAGDSDLDVPRLAARIAVEGVEAALKREAGKPDRRAPLGKFGDLLTLDRREIEGYRSVSSLMVEYSLRERPERPLSVAVFGPPGSGKSFGISAVAKAALGDGVEKITFNLSQFKDPSELLGALHQVRDRSLKGKLPLVFWDEFDTALDGQPLGWLRYFLAPMQDGEFLEGRITHPIGRAIFVFAGGTGETLSEFGHNLGLSEAELKAVKHPDFVSRLKGFVDILGPDPVKRLAGHDQFYVVRRAVLLRSMLERHESLLFSLPPTGKKDDGVLQIDEGVLRAFLGVRRYRHGARSMESIIAMSLLTGKTRFDRSSLPPESQLDPHVNGRAFLALVNQIDLSKFDDEKFKELAALNQQNYCSGLPEGERQPYDALPDYKQEQNRQTVRDIPDTLAAAGYALLPAPGPGEEENLPGAVVERLAEVEHERWMRLMIRKGYVHVSKDGPDDKKHEAILPWRKMSAEERAVQYSRRVNEAIGEDELPEAEKRKVRAQVRGIPDILRAVDYILVRVEEEERLPPTGGGCLFEPGDDAGRGGGAQGEGAEEKGAQDEGAA